MPQNSVLRLDNQLCFALYRATQAITSVYRSQLKALGLTYPQYLVLLVLWEHGDCSVGNISRRLDLDSGTLTPLLKRLESAGFVSRTRSNDDERIVIVSLTRQSKRMRARVAGVQRDVVARTRLQVGEFNELRRRLHQLSETLFDDDDQGGVFA